MYALPFYSDAVAHFLSDEEVSPISYIADDVEFRFPNGALGLKDINISEGNNKLIAIMGASGAGKTTLLNTLSGLEKPSNGTIKINGKDIFDDKDDIEGVIGYISQDDILIEELTVYQNLYFSAKLCLNNLPETEIHERVEKVLEKMGIMHRRNHFPQQLSGGQQQRVAISRAVVNNPKIILADEPTGNLDSTNGNDVMQLLTELNDQGTTIIMVTHSEHDAKYSHRIIRMLDGKTVTENILV